MPIHLRNNRFSARTREKFFLTAVLLALLACGPKGATQAQVYQPFPTDSASWNVVRCWYLFLPGWYDHYRISIDGSDTAYAGQTYKKIMITQHLRHGSFDSLYPPQFFGGMRENNKQVFMFQSWASVDTTEHLVYDFNPVNPGDTIFTSCLAAPSSILLGHLVVAADSVLVGTKYHRRLLLQDPNNPSNAEYWIEGVGSSWGLPFASFWSITDNSYDLTCFYKKDTLQYANPAPSFGFCMPPLPSVSCDSVLTHVHMGPAQGADVSIFPNPATHGFTLLHEGIRQGAAVLYDTPGRAVRHIKLQPGKTTFSSLGLTPGVYMIRISTKDGMYIKKVVIR